VVTLTAIAAVASFGLSAVYNATHEITEEYKRLETENARIEVLPSEGGEYFEETATDSMLDGREFAYYTAYASEVGAVIRGYTFTAYGKGYSSTIETIVGVVPDGSISGIKIVQVLEDRRSARREEPGRGRYPRDNGRDHQLGSGHGVGEEWPRDALVHRRCRGNVRRRA
jgi:Na+-translocating ferredoxin:NAD+ oxidoreductase RnfG subunit